MWIRDYGVIHKRKEERHAQGGVERQDSVGALEDLLSQLAKSNTRRYAILRRVCYNACSASVCCVCYVRIYVPKPLLEFIPAIDLTRIRHSKIAF